MCDNICGELLWIKLMKIILELFLIVELWSGFLIEVIFGKFIKNGLILGLGVNLGFIIYRVFDLGKVILVIFYIFY